MTYRIVVPVEGSGGFINGVTVDAWKVSRFANTNVPAKDSSPPSGSPDAGPVTTATNGAPGQAVLDVDPGYSYNIRVQQGSNAYWTQTSEPVAAASLTSFQGRTTAAATLTKADVTGTGLTYSDVGADASGAAASKVAKDSLVYNVLDHGVVCDGGAGNTDNAAAINALIAAIPAGATIYFPPATVGTSRYYGVRSSIEITKPVVLRGDSLGTQGSSITTRIRALSGFTGGALVRNFSSSDYDTPITSASVTTSSGSPTMTDPTAPSSAYVGALAVGTGIPAATYVKSIAGTTVTLTANATASGTVSVTYGDSQGTNYAPVNCATYVNVLVIKDLTLDLGTVCNNTCALQLVGIMERTEIRNLVIQNNSSTFNYGNVALGIYNSLSTGAIGRYIIDHITVYGLGWLHELAVDATNNGTISGAAMLDPVITNWTTVPMGVSGETHNSSIFYFNGCIGAIIEGHAEGQVPNSPAPTWQASTSYAKDAPIVVNGIQYWASAAGTSGSSSPAFYGTWQPSTAYTTGTIVNNLLGSSSSAVLWQATTGGTSGSTAPTWSYTTGATISDGSVTWTVIGVASAAAIADNGFNWTVKTTAPYAAQPWTASTYVPSDTSGAITITEPDGANPSYAYRCTSSGVTGASAPSWNRTLGGTTTDGTATWTCISTDLTDAATVRLVDCPDAIVRVLFKLDQWAIATRPVVRATQTTALTTTSIGAVPMSSPRLDHCIFSHQNSRHWIGNIVEDGMGALSSSPRVLAYDPANFNPSWLTYDGITANYGNASNYTPFNATPTVISYVSTPVTLGGDVTGSSSANTVGKVQGVALTSDQATIVSQLSNVVTTTTLGTAPVSRTMTKGEYLVVNGASGSPAATLPTIATSPATSIGTTNIIANSTSSTIAISSGSTMRYLTGIGSYTQPANTATVWRWSGAAWILVGLSYVSPLLTSNNLSELTATASTARTNLGLGTAATSATSDFLSSSATASGDVTGTLGSSLTVGKVQGVAISTAEATLVTQADQITTTTTLGVTPVSRTMVAGEMLVINGASGSPAAVLPTTPTAGTTNIIANNTSLTIALSSGTTLRYFGTASSSYTQAANSLTTWRYSGLSWVLVAVSPSSPLLTSGGTMSGAIAMGTNKITGLGNGSAAQDAAAFGQIPTALPPNGSASGDLTGTYPGPTLATAYAGSSPVGSATAIPVLTIDTKGRITATSTATPSDTTRVAKAGDTMSGALAMGANKITGLANGTASTDAAAFGQIPTKGVELASTVYAPASQTTKTQSSGTVPAVFDATNLTVTFTAPASGKVLVELSGYIQVGTAGTSAIWNVCTHGGTTPVGTWMSATAGVNGVNVTTRCYVSGLTAGNSYQWDWLAQTGNSGTVTQTLTCYGSTGATAGGAGAPAIMRIISA